MAFSLNPAESDNDVIDQEVESSFEDISMPSSYGELSAASSYDDLSTASLCSSSVVSQTSGLSLLRDQYLRQRLSQEFNTEDLSDNYSLKESGIQPVLELNPGPRAYVHTPNPRLNGKLNLILALSVFTVIGLGIGNYIGWTNHWRHNRQLSLGQVLKLKQLQDELIVCMKNQVKFVNNNTQRSGEQSIPIKESPKVTLPSTEPKQSTEIPTEEKKSSSSQTVYNLLKDVLIEGSGVVGTKLREVFETFADSDNISLGINTTQTVISELNQRLRTKWKELSDLKDVLSNGNQKISNKMSKLLEKTVRKLRDAGNRLLSKEERLQSRVDAFSNRISKLVIDLDNKWNNLLNKLTDRYSKQQKTSEDNSEPKNNWFFERAKSRRQHQKRRSRGNQW